jgi:hypothetical protein
MAELSADLHGLVELGLSRYEAKAYLALIQRESYVASELANATGIPRQRIYDVLSSLVSRGLARDWPGPVNRYAATDPLIAVGRLLAVQRHAFSSLEARSAALATGMRDTWVVGRTETAPLDYVEVLRDPGLLGARFLNLQRGAESELLTFSKSPHPMPNNQVGLAATRRIAQAGGDVRCIYEANALDNPTLVAEALQFIQAGGGARIADEVPMTLCLADGHRALLILTDPTAGSRTPTTILVEHRALTSSLRWAFDALWELSEPYALALERHARASAHVVHEKAGHRRAGHP